MVIAYDIPDDGRRNRLARLLRGYGERVQLSVFEAHLEPPLLALLKERVAKVIRHEEDSVRFYKLGSAWNERVETLGLGQILPEPGEAVV